jgi:DNA mismatch repair protein MSH4
VSLHKVNIVRLTSQITLNPVKLSIAHVEQSVNHVIMLKSYVHSILPIYEALTSANSALLLKIRDVRPIYLYKYYD